MTPYKTDKNGTQYFVSYKCQRCGGLGHIDKYHYNEGGICYECGGSGVSNKARVTKIYIPEYKAKLDAKREKRNAIKFAAERAEAEKKAAEKAARDEAIRLEKEAKLEAIKLQNAKSNYVGTVGEILKVSAKLESAFVFHRAAYFYGDSGVTYMYKFVTEENNIIIWKSSVELPEDYKGKVLEIKAKVVSHSEYKEAKQTEVKNAKVSIPESDKATVKVMQKIHERAMEDLKQCLQLE